MGKKNVGRRQFTNDELKLRCCIVGVINYLVSRGLEYGSDNEWFVAGEWATARYNLVRERWKILYGTLCPFSMGEMAPYWIQVRKDNYKTLQAKMPIGHDRNGTKLLIDEDVCVTIYATLCQIASYDDDVVKIGYTSQNLDKYLAGKKIAHNPRLLATRPGTREDETRFHAMWHADLVAGREWFRLTDEMISWFQREWVLSERFYCYVNR